LPLVNLHFGGNSGNESLCTEVTLVRHRCRRFPLLCLFDNRSKLCSTVDLLDNFLHFLKLFFHDCGERFHDIAMTENGWGKERKINGELATPILLTGREGELKQTLFFGKWTAL
jgi:hypothetical protein